MAERFSHDDFPMPDDYSGPSNGFNLLRSIDGHLSRPQPYGKNVLEIDGGNHEEQAFVNLADVESSEDFYPPD